VMALINTTRPSSARCQPTLPHSSHPHSPRPKQSGQHFTLESRARNSRCRHPQPPARHLHRPAHTANEHHCNGVTPCASLSLSLWVRPPPPLPPPPTVPCHPPHTGTHARATRPIIPCARTLQPLRVSPAQLAWHRQGSSQDKNKKSKSLRGVATRTAEISGIPARTTGACGMEAPGHDAGHVLVAPGVVQQGLVDVRGAERRAALEPSTPSWRGSDSAQRFPAYWPHIVSYGAF
jgi:hypothetical protein